MYANHAVIEPVTVKGSETESVFQHVFTVVRSGEVLEAVKQFADSFTFSDYALELEFHDKPSLEAFFTKTRELFPDLKFKECGMYTSGAHAVSEWEMTATHREPALGGLFRHIPISVRGVSVLEMKGGKITRWSDYYDGLRSRRDALQTHFSEWVEL